MLWFDFAGFFHKFAAKNLEKKRESSNSARKECVG